MSTMFRGRKRKLPNSYVPEPYYSSDISNSDNSINIEPENVIAPAPPHEYLSNEEEDILSSELDEDLVQHLRETSTGVSGSSEDESNHARIPRHRLLVRHDQVISSSSAEDEEDEAQVLLLEHDDEESMAQSEHSNEDQEELLPDHAREVEDHIQHHEDESMATSEPSDEDPEQVLPDHAREVVQHNLLDDDDQVQVNLDDQVNEEQDEV